MLYILSHPEARRRAIEAVRQAPDGYVVKIMERTRTLSQNDALWAALQDLAEQVTWHGQKLTKEQWKDVLTAALLRQKVVPGIGGGFVVLGTSTRRMKKSEMSDLIDLIHAFGADQGVKFGANDE
jgi:hypothetical protein